MQNEKAISALLAVFPTIESFSQCAKDAANAPTVASFVSFAHRAGIIKSPKMELLATFLKRESSLPVNWAPPPSISFETFLERKDEFINVKLSLRGWTDRINALLTSEKIELPKVSNSMLTRLKIESADTAYKQNVLRSIAFWIGHERSLAGRTWNYETLMKLCSDIRTETFNEGVRVGFALYSRGDMIDNEIMNWLRKRIKGFMEEPDNGFLGGRWGKVRSLDITTLYVDIPKNRSSNDLVSFRPSLKKAIALAHQISICWALSKYNTRKRILSIGIVIGEYASVNNYLVPILMSKLPGDPVIRISDYAYQAILISDLRVILCKNPKETTLFNGEALSIWWLNGFWSVLYFDFAPELIREEILGNGPLADEKRTRLLWLSDEAGPKTSPESGTNAISIFLRSPHNSLLGIEIAKTLYYRRHFEDAQEVLRMVLSISPTDLVARTLLMELFRSMALNAENYEIAEAIFRQAEREAAYIEKHCTLTEDFYCEYSGVQQAIAMFTLRYIRGNPEVIQTTEDMQKFKDCILSRLEKAEHILEDAIIYSPSAVRSSYLLNCNRILKAVLTTNPKIFTDRRVPIDANASVVRRPSTNLHRVLGYARMDKNPDAQYDLLEKMMLRGYRIHDDAISLRTFSPTNKFCTAVWMWDFLPKRTVGMAKLATQLLKRALETARAAEKENLCIYSFTRAYQEMMPAGEFADHIEKSIAMIQKKSGGSFKNRKDSEIIDPGQKASSMLMTLNFD